MRPEEHDTQNSRALQGAACGEEALLKAGIVSRAMKLCLVKVCMQSKRMVTHCIDSAGAWCAVQRHTLRDTMLPV